MQRLNIIVGKRVERLPILMEEIRTQGITNFKFWDGIYLPSIKKSINLAHKQIVEYAKIAEFPSVIIAEDDIQFTHPDSYRYFLSRMPEKFDLYLGGVFLGDPDDRNRLSFFTGLSLYAVSEGFYDKFLSTPDDEHLDRALDGLGEYIVCRPFVCRQHNGWSSNTGKYESYDYLLRNRTFFTGI